MRKQLAALVLAGTAIAGLAGAPAAHAEDTVTSFTLTGGALSITVPATATLTGGNTAITTSDITGQLGNTTVTDARGALVATWTASVTGTEFTTGAGGANRTVPLTNISYWSGAGTGSGIVTPVPGQLTALNAQALTTSRTAMAATVAVGNNTISWNPTLVVTVPAGNVAGTYTGTITHSVA